MRKHVRRTVAGLMVLGTVGLGIGFASPAGAAGRNWDHNSASNNGCDSQYWRNSGTGAYRSGNWGAPNSDQAYCS